MRGAQVPVPMQHHHHPAAAASALSRTQLHEILRQRVVWLFPPSGWGTCSPAQALALSSPLIAAPSSRHAWAATPCASISPVFLAAPVSANRPATRAQCQYHPAWSAGHPTHRQGLHHGHQAGVAIAGAGRRAGMLWGGVSGSSSSGSSSGSGGAGSSNGRATGCGKKALEAASNASRPSSSSSSSSSNSGGGGGSSSGSSTVAAGTAAPADGGSAAAVRAPKRRARLRRGGSGGGAHRKGTGAAAPPSSSSSTDTHSCSSSSSSATTTIASDSSSSSSSSSKRRLRPRKECAQSNKGRSGLTPQPLGGSPAHPAQQPQEPLQPPTLPPTHTAPPLTAALPTPLPPHTLAAAAVAAAYTSSLGSAAQAPAPPPAAAAAADSPHQSIDPPPIPPPAPAPAPPQPQPAPKLPAIAQMPLLRATTPLLTPPATAPAAACGVAQQQPGHDQARALVDPRQLTALIRRCVSLEQLARVLATHCGITAQPQPGGRRGARGTGAAANEHASSSRSSSGVGGSGKEQHSSAGAHGGTPPPAAPLPPQRLPSSSPPLVPQPPPSQPQLPPPRLMDGVAVSAALHRIAILATQQLPTSSTSAAQQLPRLEQGPVGHGAAPRVNEHASSSSSSSSSGKASRGAHTSGSGSSGSSGSSSHSSGSSSSGNGVHGSPAPADAPAPAPADAAPAGPLPELPAPGAPAAGRRAVAPAAPAAATPAVLAWAAAASPLTATAAHDAAAAETGGVHSVAGDGERGGASRQLRQQAHTSYMEDALFERQVGAQRLAAALLEASVAGGLLHGMGWRELSSLVWSAARIGVPPSHGLHAPAPLHPLHPGSAAAEQTPAAGSAAAEQAPAAGSTTAGSAAINMAAAPCVQPPPTIQPQPLQAAPQPSLPQQLPLNTDTPAAPPPAPAAPTTPLPPPSMLSVTQPWVQHVMHRMDSLGFQSADVQALSNTIWALAKLEELPPPSWLAGYMQAVLAALPSLQAQHLTNIIHALARLHLCQRTRWQAQLSRDGTLLVSSGAAAVQQQQRRQQQWRRQQRRRQAQHGTKTAAPSTQQLYDAHPVGGAGPSDAQQPSLRPQRVAAGVVDSADMLPPHPAWMRAFLAEVYHAMPAPPPGNHARAGLSSPPPGPTSRHPNPDAPQEDGHAGALGGARGSLSQQQLHHHQHQLQRRQQQQQQRAAARAAAGPLYLLSLPQQYANVLYALAVLQAPCTSRWLARFWGASAQLLLPQPQHSSMAGQPGAPWRLAPQLALPLSQQQQQQQQQRHARKPGRWQLWQQRRQQAHQRDTTALRPQHLSNMLWAAAKLCASGAAPRPPAGWLDVVEVQLLQQAPLLSGQELANVVYAYGLMRARPRHPDLLPLLLTWALQHARWGQLMPQGAANIVWGVARMHACNQGGRRKQQQQQQSQPRHASLRKALPNKQWSGAGRGPTEGSTQAAPARAWAPVGAQSAAVLDGVWLRQLLRAVLRTWGTMGDKGSNGNSNSSSCTGSINTDRIKTSSSGSTSSTAKSSSAAADGRAGAGVRLAGEGGSEEGFSLQAVANLLWGAAILGADPGSQTMRQLLLQRTDPRARSVQQQQQQQQQAGEAGGQGETLEQVAGHEGKHCQEQRAGAEAGSTGMAAGFSAGIAAEHVTVADAIGASREGGTGKQAAALGSGKEEEEEEEEEGSANVPDGGQARQPRGPAGKQIRWALQQLGYQQLLAGLLLY